MEDLPKNLKMIIAYEGTAYSGFQIQKNGPTVQAELKAVIEHITGETVDLQGAGRTDAGVHARGQVVHFHTHSNLSVEKLKKALNSLLPADIVVRNICEVSMDFHARHSAVSKTYSYCLYNSEERPLFERNYVYHYKAVLNITKMKEAVPFLLGKKDFKSFQAKGSAVLTTIRVVNFCHLELKGSLIVFTINANGFLYHMVRNIIGTLILIGREKINPSEMEQIIMGKDRAMAGETAPAMGLCLEEVLY